MKLFGTLKIERLNGDIFYARYIKKQGDTNICW